MASLSALVSAFRCWPRGDRFASPAPPVVWDRFGNVTRRVLVQGVLPLLPQIVVLIEAGERVVEVRGPWRRALWELSGTGIP